MSEQVSANNGVSRVPSKRLAIVAVDGSHTAEHAFEWYIEHLHKPENEVIVLHIVDVQTVHVYPSLFVRPEIAQAEIVKEKERARALEESYIKKLHDYGVSGRFVMEAGKPGEVIVRIANDSSAEYVILAPRGQGKLRRTVLGSVSDYVVHHAHCAVITVRKNVPL